MKCKVEEREQKNLEFESQRAGLRQSALRKLAIERRECCACAEQTALHLTRLVAGRDVENDDEINEIQRM